MKRKIVVYRIVNSVNGKCYVGSSWRFAQRWKRHMGDLKAKCHHSKVMQREYNVYGKKVFSHEILEELDDVKLARSREEFWINHFDSHNSGYNASWNGLYRTMNDQERDELHKAMKSHWEDPKNVEAARRRAIRQFSNKAARESARKKQLEFIKNNPERARQICRDAGLANAEKTRERCRVEIKRSDGKVYLAIMDAARDMAKSKHPVEIERARGCIKQALKRKNITLGYRWYYCDNK